MKLAIIASTNTYECQRISKEGSDFFDKIELFLIPDLTVKIKNKKNNFLYKNQPFPLGFDIYLFRGTSKGESLAVMLAEFLNNKGKIIVDEKLARPKGGSKFTTLLKLNTAGISVPVSFQALAVSEILNQAKKIGYPIIAKHKKGKKGKGVYKLDNKKELALFTEKNQDLESIIFQQFIDSNFDIRVFVVGDKALGSMKRTAPAGDFRSNIAVGGTGEKFDASRDLCNMAIKSIQAVRNEIAGIDVMIKNNQAYVIEVNRAPEFQGFEKNTGVNVARKILE
ncbi:unnamed protein product, partial [marine sediment metagenome]